jgi:cytochrome c oxidase cbb3-type subunit 3
MSRFVITTTLALGLALGAVGSAQAEDIKQVYDFYCAQCHGVNGDGKGVNVTADFATDPRNFTAGAEMAKRTDEDIKGVIKDGGPSIKVAIDAALGCTLSAAQVDGLLGYIRKFAK